MFSFNKFNKFKPNIFNKRNISFLTKNDIFDDDNNMKNNWNIITDKTKPSYVIGIGEYLFRQKNTGSFFAIGDKAVVIGNNQNYWDQVIVNNIDKDNIEVIRRDTGGGSVVIDNCIMCGFEAYNTVGIHRKILDNVITSSLDQFLKYKPEIVGKNDIKVLMDQEYFKIIGQAFKISGNKYKQHFSGLINSDFSLITRYLQQDQTKNLSKGTKSNISNVVNMYDIKHEKLNETSVDEFMGQIFAALVKQFKTVYKEDTTNIYIVNSLNDANNYPIYNKYFSDYNIAHISAFLENDKIMDKIKCITDNDYVKNSVLNDPTFRKKFRKSWGTIDVQLIIDHNTNIIIKSKVFSDMINLDVINNLPLLFDHCIFAKRDLTTRLQNIAHLINADNLPIMNDIIDELFVE